MKDGWSIFSWGHMVGTQRYKPSWERHLRVGGNKLACFKLSHTFNRIIYLQPNAGPYLQLWSAQEKYFPQNTLSYRAKDQSRVL